MRVALHWGAIVLFTVAVLSGFRMADTGWPGVGVLSRPFLYSLHQTVGLAVCCLMVLWFALRWRGLIATRSEGLIARILLVYHLILAGLGFSIAGLGLAGLVVGGGRFDLLLLAEFHLSILDRKPDWVVWFFDIHAQIVPWFLGMLALHILGALFHAIVLRDGVFSAMLWRGPKR